MTKSGSKKKNKPKKRSPGSQSSQKSVSDRASTITEDQTAAVSTEDHPNSGKEERQTTDANKPDSEKPLTGEEEVEVEEEQDQKDKLEGEAEDSSSAPDTRDTPTGESPLPLGDEDVASENEVLEDEDQMENGKKHPNRSQGGQHYGSGDNNGGSRGNMPSSKPLPQVPQEGDPDGFRRGRAPVYGDSAPYPNDDGGIHDGEPGVMVYRDGNFRDEDLLEHDRRGGGGGPRDDPAIPEIGWEKAFARAEGQLRGQQDEIEGMRADNRELTGEIGHLRGEIDHLRAEVVRYRDRAHRAEDDLEDIEKRNRHRDPGSSSQYYRDPRHADGVSHESRSRLPAEVQFDHDSSQVVVPLLQAMNVGDAESAVRAWNRTQRELSDLREHVKTLEAIRREALESTDRFQPAMDNDFAELVKKLNKGIGPLVTKMTKDKFFQKLLWLPDDPDYLRRWHLRGVLFESGVHPRLLARPWWVSESPQAKTYQKLLLYHVVWKFLSDSLLDGNKPFAAYQYGSSEHAVDKYTHNTFMHLFYPEGHAARSFLEPNEEAAKWRAATAARLDAVEPAGGSTIKVEELVGEFANFLTERLAARDPSTLVSAAAANGDDHDNDDNDADEGGAVRAALSSEIMTGRPLRNVFATAVEMARLAARQRARFALEMPRVNDADGGRYKPPGEDEQMTTLSGTGIAVGSSEDAEADGNVLFCVAPMLVKHGNGAGRNFDEASVVSKSFVQVFDG